MLTNLYVDPGLFSLGPVLPWAAAMEISNRFLVTDVTCQVMLAPSRAMWFRPL